jgi:hypothetical protein
MVINYLTGFGSGGAGHEYRDSNFRYLSQGATSLSLFGGFGPEVSRLCLCDSLPANDGSCPFCDIRRGAAIDRLQR